MDNYYFAITICMKFLQRIFGKSKFRGGFFFGGGSDGKSPHIPAPEPFVPVEQVVPVQKVEQKDETQALQKSLAKKRRATLLATGTENQPNIFKQKLGAQV
jgi:hypothetical protein